MLRADSTCTASAPVGTRSGHGSLNRKISRVPATTPIVPSGTDPFHEVNPVMCRLAFNNKLIWPWPPEILNRVRHSEKLKLDYLRV